MPLPGGADHRPLAVFTPDVGYESSELVSLTNRSSVRRPGPIALSRQEVQEVTMNLSHGTSPSQSHLETLQRPVPMSMTLQEASFHRQNYTPHPHLPQPHHVMSSVPSLHSSLQFSPHNVPKSPSQFRTALSLPYRPVGSKVVPGMMIRKPEPLSWIKYPVEPHRIHPGPYAAVEVPFEDVNDSFDVPRSSKAKLSSTWGPQKLRCLQKSRKCVRFASTWGPVHPAVVGEYATINPKKLTSRYVRPAIFRRSNLKCDPRHE